jgi:hypothetical protein
MALETQVTLHMHSDITTASKERKEKQGKIADRACVVIKLATIPCVAGRSP